jgi:hypothetical protein
VVQNLLLVLNLLEHYSNEINSSLTYYLLISWLTVRVRREICVSLQSGSDGSYAGNSSILSSIGRANSHNQSCLHRNPSNSFFSNTEVYHLSQSSLTSISCHGVNCGCQLSVIIDYLVKNIIKRANKGVRIIAQRMWSRSSILVFLIG